MNTQPAKIFFIEMMGIPGSYDASVYDHFQDKDDEGLWFVKRFGGFPGISIETRNVCIGERLPAVDEADGVVLAGSYNSVHDHTEWQMQIRRWLPVFFTNKVPLLGICGAHQLIAHMRGSGVEEVTGGPFAGTFPIALTSEGEAAPLLEGINSDASFQYANTEHVTDIPPDSTLLASSSAVPVAALDYGNHCYTTQFHPEGTWETLGTVWRKKRPELMDNYHAEENGYRLVTNFLQIVLDNT